MGSADRRYFRKVSNHHFHDATMGEVRVIPATSKRHKARIEVALSFPHVDLRFLLTFKGCTNFSAALDFDVLADQLPYNTACFEVSTDTTKIRELILAQMDSWNVEYDDEPVPNVLRQVSGYSSGRSPLKVKYGQVGRLKRYCLRHFGGILTVLATSHSIRCLE